jgi:predicted O-methyltransferase YrrM
MSNSSVYNFSNLWFENYVKSSWDLLIPQLKPTCILEIGSYEGASTCYLIEKLATQNNVELHCIDTWLGGIENQEGGFAESNMFDVEKRFHHNIKIAKSRVSNNTRLIIHKNFSHLTLSKLITEGKLGYFDFIYVDGSHQAPDVLSDAILSFKLLKKNGVMVFDDYLWNESLSYGIDPIRSPKIAIDAFTNIYCRKIKIISAVLFQLYVQKIND